MKIASIKKTNYDNGCQTTNPKSYQVGLNNVPGKDSVSFGGVVDGFKSKSTGVFKFIERAGFFVEFLIVDTFSMILPRIAVGLDRDRDKTGQLNYKAGAEEAGREIMSGPTMNLIPMGILTATCAFKPTARMSKETINTLHDAMIKVTQKTSNLNDKGGLDKALAEKIFDGAFEKANVSSDLKKSFIKMLTESPNVEVKLFNKEVLKNNKKSFEDLVAQINNGLKSETAPLNPKGIKVNGTDMKAGELYEDFANYSKDVIAKLSKAEFTGDIGAEARKFLRDIKGRRLNLKLATAISAFFAVGSFLLYLPKLYQKGSVSPAEESARRAREGVVQGGANENR